MTSSVEIQEVRAVVKCGCGEAVEVVLKEADIMADGIEADAYVQAEEDHGWSDGGFCPSCGRAYEAECAADGEMRRAKEGRAA